MKISYYPGCTLKTKARNLDQAAIIYLTATSGIEAVAISCAHFQKVVRPANVPGDHILCWVRPEGAHVQDAMRSQFLVKGGRVGLENVVRCHYPTSIGLVIVVQLQLPATMGKEEV